MDLSSKIPPALHQLTSSFASTTNRYGGFIVSRVLSFTGSFNDRTSLLRHEQDAELGRPTQTEDAGAAIPSPPGAPEATAPAAASVTTAPDHHPFDIEGAATTTTTTPLAPTAPGGPAATEVDAESRRVGKSVQTVCLFAASASLVLFVNLPTNKQPAGPGAAPPAGLVSPSGQHGGGAATLLYRADMAFISLGFFSSLGLSMFSIVARPGEAAVARVQKWGMVAAIASVVVAFLLRLCMPPAA